MTLRVAILLPTFLAAACGSSTFPPEAGGTVGVPDGGVSSDGGAVDAAALRAAIDDAVGPSMARPDSVGLVVGVIDGASRTIAFYGESTRGSGKSPASDTLFQIASNTKCVTATLLAFYARQGTLSLSDAVGTYLPGSYAFASGPKVGITLEQLADHTSGFPRNPDNVGGATTYPIDALYADADSTTLQSTPGTTFLYSNMAYSLLGYALANKLGRSWESLVADVVTTPLGMRDTKTYEALDADELARAATGYTSATSPSCATPPCALPPSFYLASFPPPAMHPAGGLFSTPADMMTWLAYNMGLAANPPLDALLDTLRQKRASAGPSQAVGLAWNTSPIALSGATLDVVWKDGDTAGYHSFVGYVPARKVGVFVLANFPISPAPHDLGLQVLTRLP